MQTFGWRLLDLDGFSLMTFWAQYGEFIKLALIFVAIIILLKFKIPLSGAIGIGAVLTDVYKRQGLSIPYTGIYLMKTPPGKSVLFCWRQKKMCIRDSAYSTQYELQMSQKSSALLLALGAMPQTCDLEQAAQLPEYLKEPVDFWCETGALSASVQEQTLLVSGKLRYCMLGTDADGAPVYFEQAQDVAQEYQLETKADSYLTELFITVQDCQYEIQEKNKLQYHCKLQVDGMVLGVIPVSFITGIKVDETREKKRENQSAMTIYYADAGENIWSIAKRYNTSLSAVMEENGLEEEILPEKQIVLIRCV